MFQAFLNPSAQDIPAVLFGALVFLLCAAFTYLMGMRLALIARSLPVTGVDMQRDELNAYSNGLTAMSVLSLAMVVGLICMIITI